MGATNDDNDEVISSIRTIEDITIYVIDMESGVVYVQCQYMTVLPNDFVSSCWESVRFFNLMSALFHGSYACLVPFVLSVWWT